MPYKTHLVAVEVVAVAEKSRHHGQSVSGHLLGVVGRGFGTHLRPEIAPETTKVHIGDTKGELHSIQLKLPIVPMT